MQPNDVILITGGNGLAGIALAEHLKSQGFTNVVAASSKDCDLTDRKATVAYFQRIQPAYVFHMAGFVFGIMGNMRFQAEAYLNNNLINTHVVEGSQKAGVKKIVAMGTVAMYPDIPGGRAAVESDIWIAPPHGSEKGYAHAKRGMLGMLEVYKETHGMDFAVAISTNLYGPHDKFNIETGHVIPSLIRKFYEAKQSGASITIWGDGSAQRDFLYINDCARALSLMMDKLDGPINMATGTTHLIREAVEILAAHTGMQDKIVWDKTKPNGQLIRHYDISILKNAGFKCLTSLKEGLTTTYDWYAANHATART